VKKIVMALFIGAVVVVSGCADSSAGEKKYVDVNSSSVCYTYEDKGLVSDHDTSVCFTPQQVVIDPDKEEQLDQTDIEIYGTYSVRKHEVQGQ